MASLFDDISQGIRDPFKEAFAPKKRSETAAKSPGSSYDVSDVLYFRKNQKLSFFYVASDKNNPLVVEFKAFITQFDDQYQSKWTPNSVYGRMDPIATFENTTRRISLGFSIPAYDNDEARANMSKMSTLINMLYPVYRSAHAGASQIVGAPLLKMKFGNLIRKAPDATTGATDGDVISDGLLGYLDGASFTPAIEAGFHDPAPGAGHGLELYPMELRLNCSFNVLHEHKMGFSLSDRDVDNGFMTPEGYDPATTKTRRRRGGFPYGSQEQVNSRTQSGITKPNLSSTRASEECKESNYTSALGITTDSACKNSAVVTPEGSFRDSEMGKIFKGLDIMSKL